MANVEIKSENGKVECFVDGEKLSHVLSASVNYTVGECPSVRFDVYSGDPQIRLDDARANILAPSDLAERTVLYDMARNQGDGTFYSTLKAMLTTCLESDKVDKGTSDFLAERMIRTVLLREE